MTHEQRTEHQETAERHPRGRRILQRVRDEVNTPDSHFGREDGRDVFRQLYLTERAGCIPDELLGEDILLDIRSLFYGVLDGIRGELQERVGQREFIWILVDPSYEDATSAVLLTEDKFLLHVHRKAWHFFWPNEEEMAQELEDWYQQAAERLGLAEVAGAATSSEAREQEFVVTLRIARMLVVRAPGPERAAELAMAWQDNENDPNVQLTHEEVLDGTVHTAGEADNETFLKRSRDEEGGGR